MSPQDHMRLAKQAVKRLKTTSNRKKTVRTILQHLMESLETQPC